MTYETLTLINTALLILIAVILVLVSMSQDRKIEKLRNQASLFVGALQAQSDRAGDALRRLDSLELQILGLYVRLPARDPKTGRYVPRRQPKEGKDEVGQE